MARVHAADGVANVRLRGAQPGAGAPRRPRSSYGQLNRLTADSLGDMSGPTPPSNGIADLDCPPIDLSEEIRP